jgi:hypothetical protein
MMGNIVDLFPEYPASHPSGLKGTFRFLDKDNILVRSEHGEKPARIGNSRPEVIAMLVLREFADEAAQLPPAIPQ